MNKIPLGYSSFSDLISNNKIYVDKTKYFYDLVNNGKFYFLSRPRRFGKSLTVSTLKEMFLGNRELFKGTYIYDSDYSWKEYPVIHIDFSQFDADYSADELKELIIGSINGIANEYGVELKSKLRNSRFSELIHELSKKAQVVILIDEYDNPFISNITNIEKANKIKDILKGFYKIIKSCDEYVKFAFLTGVTKFSQVSVFSGLNNLIDLTMDKRYSSICGYTQKELEYSFKEYISQWAVDQNVTETEILDDIKNWYNGFLFSAGGVTVYNPWSTLNYFNTGEFKNYWFETGTPAFLINLVKNTEFNISDKESFDAEAISFSTFDIENLNPIALLFQTGYITIKEYNRDLDYYTLGYPNREVEQSFIDSLLQSTSNINSNNTLIRLTKSLLKNDLETFFESIDILFSKIDYDLHLKNEKYWQSIFYMILTLLGYKIFVEFKTVKGRIDAVIETKTHIYIFEFKTTATAKIALDQIKEREYYTRFKDSGKNLVLVGSQFLLEDKKIVNRYESEELCKS